MTLVTTYPVTSLELAKRTKHGRGHYQLAPVCMRSTVALCILPLGELSNWHYLFNCFSLVRTVPVFSPGDTKVWTLVPSETIP